MSKIKICGGNVYTEDEGFRPQSLCILNERIVSEEEYRASDIPETFLQADGMYVIPGLTDIHLHGCAGYDCCDGTPEAFQAIAEYELKHGITSITPATMTLPKETLEKVVQAAASYKKEESRPGKPAGADLCGLYMEGPFINPAKKGAQNEFYVRRPDIDLFRHLQELSGGLFRTVTVAPEQEGAMDFIRAAAGEVTVSLAHMTADYDTACRAFEAGASQITHLFNAMPDFSHREPGPAGAAADHPGVRVELICDGLHIHPSVVRAVFKIFGDGRVIMISDSMRATGMPDGVSELGGQTVYKKGNRAVLADGTIAGSATNLMDCLRTAVREMRIPLESAVRAAAVNPARAIGIYGDYGRLAPGSLANVVILDRDLELRQVIHRGLSAMSSAGGFCP